MASRIGPIPVPEPGAKTAGYFTFESDPQLAKYNWPFFSIAGAKPGPRFLLTAGIHAAEYPGIVAAIRLGRLIDPSEVAGTIVIVPLVNPGGFYERLIYVNPEDHDNLNRVFPGGPEGSWSERFAHRILNEIIVNFDYFIDLHGGDMIEDIVPFCMYVGAEDPVVDRMMNAYGLDWVVKAPAQGERPGMMAVAAAERGVHAFIAESGRVGQLEEETVRWHVDGVQNVLRDLGILSGRPAKTAPARVLNRFDWLRSEHEGIFLTRVKVNDRVREGEVLGETIDLLGNHLGQVVATTDGLILFTVSSPAVKKGGLLLGIAAPA